MVVRPIGVDHFSSVRHLHATALRSATRDALSDDEVAAFVRLVYSPAYADLLMQEEVHGGWLDGELVGTVSWHPAGNSGSTISLGGIFVRHRRLGIGRRLLAVAEAHARQSGFERLSACTTDNAVPFFLALGYETAARGVRTLAADCKLPVAFMRKPLPPLRPALH
jgi:N-acetylglutamate synthase-like GNAT family acetyltransferase